VPGGAAGVLALVPFLKARNGRRGPGHGMETSGWMTGFMQPPAVGSFRRPYYISSGIIRTK
jgi:hypothetical protein